MRTEAVRKSEETVATQVQAAATGSSDAPPPSNRAKVAMFQVGDERFAVLSVPLHDAAAMAPLSAAEREVAVLAAGGLKNAEIASYRHASVRTVANQMASLMRKLKVASRYELAARLAHCPLGEGEG
jgi:DNA-binding NarL/FixJ family response regulator